MTAFLWTLMLVLAAVVLAATAYFAIVGLLGIITNSRFVRCPSCHRLGFAKGLKLHPQGCPPATRVDHLLHDHHPLHLRHH